MSSESVALSSKEAEIYDRQIRLWGVDAQKRIRDCRVLVVSLGALGTEVVKNCVLAGMNVVLHDQSPVTEADLGTCFFLQPEDLGRGLTRASAALLRVQEMNTLVQVSLEPKALESFTDDELKAYNLVIHCGAIDNSAHGSSAGSILEGSATNGPRIIREQIAVADRCHALGVPIIVASLCGFWGTFMVDFGAEHSYMKETFEKVDKSKYSTGEDNTVVVHKPAKVHYPPLSKVISASFDKAWPKKKAQPFFAWAAFCSVALSCGASPVTVSAVVARAKEGCAAVGMEFPEATPQIASAINAYCSHFGAESIPVAAVLGGQIGQEVVKLITQKGDPLEQCFIYDAMEGSGGAGFKVEGL